MDYIFNFFGPEPVEQAPQKPQMQLSPNDVRKLFEVNQQFFKDLVALGHTEEEASRFILSHGKKI